MTEMIKVLLVEPMEEPEVIEVERDLDRFRELVGGYLQAVYCLGPGVTLVCDDDGKFKGYPPNRALVDEDGKPYDIVVGTFFICGISGEDFASLTEEQIQRFTERFRWPELFMSTDDGVMWMKLKPGDKPRMIF